MKKILITGGTGSWGKELLKNLLLKQEVEEIRIFSRNEYNQVMMQRQVKDSRVVFIVGDVRDFEAVNHACEGIDTIFHLSALKHVPICEEMPLEAIKTNIIGTESIIRASLTQGVSRVVDVSTDKACSPNNLYGMTKAVGEKLILNANKFGKTKFICIRAGNVLGSAGSVVPLFIEQIKQSNSITLTNGDMTRYFMSLPEAIKLVLLACEFTGQYNMFVMKMPSCTIRDLANTIIKKYGDSNTTITEIGARAGEKLHEELINEHEAINAYCYGDSYYVITDKARLANPVPFKSYNSNSQKLMNEQEILEMLGKGGF